MQLMEWGLLKIKQEEAAELAESELSGENHDKF